MLLKVLAASGDSVPDSFSANRQTFFAKAQLGFRVTQNSKEVCEII